MITNKEIEQSRNIIKKLIQDELILPSDQNQVNFFMKKAEFSLQTAKLLFRISEEPSLKDILKLPPTYKEYSWIINCAYYAMFYAATSLLSKYNHRLKAEQGIHSLTYHALVYYFLDNDQKLPKYILEQYQIAGKEAAELLQVAERRAREHVELVKLELSKRREFTYEMGKIAEKTKAETSLKRAEQFLTLVKEIILQ